MKIVFMIDSFPPYSRGGAGAVTLRLARGLLKIGHDVKIITSVDKKENSGRGIFEGLEVFKIFLKNEGNFRFYRGLYNGEAVGGVGKILSEIKPDVVHAQTINGALSWWSLVAAKKLCTKVFFTAHDVLPFAYSRLTFFIDKNDKTCPKNPDYKMTLFRQIKQAKKKFVPFRNWIIRKILEKNVNKVFCVSKELEVALNQNGIKNTEVLYNGLELENYQIDEEKIRKFKEDNKITDRKIILFAGRLLGSKGVDQILEFMKIVSRQYPKSILLFVGEVDNPFAFKEKINKMGLGGFVINKSWVQEGEFKIILSACDILAIPSVCFDSFPMTPEGSAMKKPVIVTCFGGAKEAMREDVSGFVLNPYNIELMAEKILFILNNEQEAKKMGLAGYELVRENLTLDGQIDKLMTFYGN